MMSEANVSNRFWYGKSVFLTGHTGFKGSWLSIWLTALGAKVTGYALEPQTTPSLFNLASVGEITESIIGDVRDARHLEEVITSSAPEIVIHLAAQAVVRESYLSPVDTYSTNVMGTVNLLEAIRHCPSVRVLINITTDKCYENRELGKPFNEVEPLGGYDPYSSSKACSEIATAAWRSSYFNPLYYDNHRVAVATARAGNVIGGGDWAQDRIVPDFFRSVQANVPITIRNPNSIRPWQHVLEPLSGYLLLAQKLYEQGSNFAEAWNFGPSESDAITVSDLVHLLYESCGSSCSYSIDAVSCNLYEANYLRLDISKASSRLGWTPRWNIKNAINATVEWMKAWQSGACMQEMTRQQIARYLDSTPANYGDGN